MRDKENFRATLNLCPQYIRLSLYEAVANFVLFGEEPQFKGSEHSSLWQLWEQIKPQIGGSVCNYSECVPQTEIQEEKERTKEKEEVCLSMSMSKEENSLFHRLQKKKDNPTLDEVKAHFQELGYGEDKAIRFYEYYDERGWRCKGEPIANWEALARSWASHEIKNNSGMQVMKTPEQIIEEYNKMYPPEPT